MALVVTGAVLVLSVGIFLVTKLGNRVSISGLKVSIPVVRAVEDEFGLELHTKLMSWDNTKGEARDQVLTAVEEFMKQKKYRQAKIVDENGKVLAAIVPGSAGMTRTYGRRIFRE